MCWGIPRGLFGDEQSSDNLKNSHEIFTYTYYSNLFIVGKD